MSRVALAKGEQGSFLRGVRTALGGGWGQVAQISGVNPRTVRDRARERWRMSLEAALRLEQHSGVRLLAGAGTPPEFWSTSKAATVRNLKWNGAHGNPGTPEGRRKGGLVSQRRRREQPERYAGSQVRLRNAIVVPPDGEELAEFIGIVLGDGTISEYQVRVALNATTDREYADYVAGLARRLFDIRVATREPDEEDVIYLTMTGRNLVEFLIGKGLCRGNKIKQRADVPEWIRINGDLARACVRGLVDTDGSIYYHSHFVRGRHYRNIGLSFTSHSLPLLMSVHKTLCGVGLAAKCDGRSHVSLYSRVGIERYLEVVGTNNQKHARRFVAWARRGDRAAEGAALEMPCTGKPCAVGSNPTLSAIWDIRRGRARRGGSGAL